jgi:hypothetical protein
MNTSPSNLHFPSSSSHKVLKQNTNKAADFESIAQIVGDFTPRFKN